MTISTAIIGFLIFFLPLLVIPLGYSYFEVPKVLIFEYFAIILVLFSVAKGYLNFEKLHKAFLYPLIGLFTLSVVTLIFLRTDVSFFGNIYRLQGVFFLWCLLLFTVASSKISLKIIPKNIYLVSLLGLLATVFIFGTDERNRFVGSLGDSNALAATAIFIWPFAFLSSKNRLLRMIGIPAVIIILGLSGSRSGFVAIAIQVIILFLTKFLKRKLSTAILIGTTFMVLSLATPFFDSPQKFENRGEIWKTAITSPYNQFRDRNFSFEALIFGRGIGNIEKVLPKLSTALDNNVRFQYVDSAHNIFLDWWIEGGITGLAIISWLIFRSTKSFIDHKNLVLSLSLIGLLTSLMFNPLSIVNLIQFWWLIGQGFSSLEST